MLKMFTAQAHSGSTSDFWDANWAPSELQRVLADPRIVENDPCYDIIKEKARPDALFLEGGCGQGQWVHYFAERGYRVVGVDFAVGTIERLRRVAPALDVRVADILSLPFADSEVHTYFSNGVVEHFETGPEPALREARRVIGRDGWFLCSVPDASWLRRRLFRGSRTDRNDLDPALTVTHVDRTIAETPPAGREFFQYAFTEEEFTRRLEDAGFAVERTFGQSFVWGLLETPYFPALYKGSVEVMRMLRGRPGGQGAIAEPSSTAQGTSEVPAGGGQGRLGSLLRRALVKEDRELPLIAPLLDFICERCASMRMFVARPA
jgi:SAM-dependent methyltransferase